MEIYICVGGIQRIEIFLLSNFSGHIVSFYRESIICIFNGVVIENHLHENEGVAQIFFYFFINLVINHFLLQYM